MPNANPTLGRQCLAEFFGTFLLILIGDGAVAVAVFTGAFDLLAVVALWGLAVTFAIYTVGFLSGAHYNPAVTVALSVFRGFPARRIPAFVGSQVAGAFTGAAVLWFLWQGFWEPTAAKLGVAIGGEGSQKLMMVFSCFYPNPGIVGTGPAELATVSTTTAFGVELVLTGVLLAVVLAVTDARNSNAPGSNLTPLFVGLCVTAVVGIGAPLTMAAINPARDFGPRLFAFLAGFGPIAFPGPRGHEAWLFIVAPLAGGLAGSAIYSAVTRQSEERSEPRVAAGGE